MKNQELVRVLGAADQSVFQQWREDTCNAIVVQKLKEEQAKAIKKGKAADKVKLSEKVLQAINESLPSGTFEALQCDSGELRKAGLESTTGECMGRLRANDKEDFGNSH